MGLRFALVRGDGSNHPHQRGIRPPKADRVDQHVRLRGIVAGDATTVRLVPVQDFLLLAPVRDHIIPNLVSGAGAVLKVRHARA